MESIYLHKLVRKQFKLEINGMESEKDLVLNRVDMDVSWVLDSKKTRSPRLFFLNDEGKNIRNSTMRLDRGHTECRTERVYIAVSALVGCTKRTTTSMYIYYFLSIFQHFRITFETN